MYGPQSGYWDQEPPLEIKKLMSLLEAPRWIIIIVVKRCLSISKIRSIVFPSNFVGYSYNVSTKPIALPDFRMLLCVDNDNCPPTTHAPLVLSICADVSFSSSKNLNVGLETSPRMPQCGLGYHNGPNMGRQPPLATYLPISPTVWKLLYMRANLLSHY